MHCPAHTVASSDFSRGIPCIFTLRLIHKVTEVVSLRPRETSLVPPPAFTTFCSPYAEEFFGAAVQILHPFCSLRRHRSGSALPVSLSGYAFDAAGFRFQYRPLFRSSFSEGYSASAPLVTRQHWEPATWLSGDYHDRTFTGK